MKKQILSILKITLLATVLSFGISYAIAWTAPSTPPPGGNVYAPINVGPDKQTKVGGDFCVSIAGIEKCLGDAQVALPVVSFSANPSIIQDRGSTTLSWPAIKNADSCVLIDTFGIQNNADVAGGTFDTGSIVSGQLSSPAASKFYTYKLQCTGKGGVTTQDAVVTVLAPSSVTVAGVYGGAGKSQAVNIPTGVRWVTFNATGGNGKNAGGCGDYAYLSGAGGGGAGAFYNTNIPIVVVGGGGGAAFGYCSYVWQGSLGGSTSVGTGAGAGGGSLFGTAGANGGPGVGGKAGGTGPGAGGTGLNDGGTAAGANGGVGGRSLVGLLNGGTGGYGGTGGGGWGGGGGGRYDSCRMGCSANIGAGGGGGYYAHPSLSAPSATGRTIDLNTVGNPTQITLVAGAGGISYGYNNNPASPGTITMSW